jgi:hypothetical protein
LPDETEHEVPKTLTHQGFGANRDPDTGNWYYWTTDGQGRSMTGVGATIEAALDGIQTWYERHGDG